MPTKGAERTIGGVYVQEALDGAARVDAPGAKAPVLQLEGDGLRVAHIEWSGRRGGASGTRRAVC